jgi:hypothetical protein
MPLLKYRRYRPNHAGLYIPAPGGGGSTTITMTSASAQHGGFGSLSSFNMAVGSYSAATDDLIFFGGDEQASNFGSSVTIGGVVATQRAVNADNKTAVWTISRGSGVSVSGGNVSVLMGGSTFGACAFAIGYSTGNASSTPTSASTTAFTFFASPNQISGTVASGGAGAVFNWDNGDAGLPFSWLPAGWARVAATEASQATGNRSQTGSAVQGTPAAGTYTLDNQRLSGAYAFIAFA